MNVCYPCSTFTLGHCAFSVVLLNWSTWWRKTVRGDIGRNSRGSFAKDYEYHFKTVGGKRGEISKNGDSQAVGGEHEAMPVFHENFCGHIRKCGVGRSGPKGKSQGGST